MTIVGGLILLAAASGAYAQVAVTAASGGGAISADDTGGSWTTLSGPVLTETATSGNGQLGTGTIVLNAPSGFEFNTGATVTVSVGRASGSGTTSNQINIGAGRGNDNTATVTATTITITVTATSASTTLNSLTWSNVQVRPTSGCPLASGNISRSGTSSFTLSSSNLGTLTEVRGVTRMYTVLAGESFSACSGVSGSPTGQTAGVAFNLTSLVVADQWGNVNTSYAGTKTVSYSGPSGSNSYTTSVAFTAGVSTTTLATTINSAQTATITATDGTVPGAASSTFTVSGPSCTTPAWYNTTWLYRKAITIDHTKVSATLSGFPVLVSVTDPDLQARAQASGNDILFTDSTGTAKLAHDLERYTSATGELIAWVNVSSVSASTDTVIYMYYGNAAAPAQQNPTGVWDANYSGVWHLKESGNGSANEYTDSTGNGNNARGGNGLSAATPSRATGKIGYGQSFNGSQLINGSSGGSLPNVNGNQTLSFWYQVASNPTTARTNFFTLRTAGGGSANQAVFVGTVSGSCASYTSPIGATQWGGACTLDANAPGAGSWHYFVFTHSGTTNTLYMDGVQVATSTTALQTGAVGDYIWGSYTTTPAEPLTGLMDETRVSIAARSAAWIQTEYSNQASPGTFLSLGTQQTNACYTHYAITVVSSTVANCDYAQVTISGHDASHNLVAPPSGTSLALSTSAGTGVWQGPGTVAGTGAWTPSGTNNGAATYVWPGGESSFTVTLRESAVTSLSVNLNDGSKVEAPLEDPAISFVNSAFRISNGANASAAIGTQISGKPSNTGFGAQTLYLQAVRTDTTTGACTSIFPSGSDVSVQVGAQCNNPAACSQNLTLTSSSPSSNSAAFVPNGAYAASMNFRFSTASAEAPFVLNYGDAGQITLQFRAAMPSPPANQFVQGAGNAFVVRPFGFAFTGASHGTTASAPVLAAAGDNFAMTLRAYKWVSGQDANNDGVPDAGVNLTGNGLTPNFAATTTLSATANLPGVATGTLSRASGAATITAAEWSGGAAAIANWRYSEVGNVFLAASSASYLGIGGADISGNSGLDGTGAAGGYIGRFRPKQFAGSTAALTPRSDVVCGASAFTYMDEPLKLTFTLTAQNAQGATTQNYDGAYAKLVLTTFSNWSLGARSGTTNLTSRIDGGVAPSGSWSNGLASGVVLTSGILRATPDNPDGPYAALQFGIAPTDADGTAMASPDFDADNNGINERKSLGVTTAVRFGRLRMDNALGPEASVLPIPIRVEYWNGTSFATNALDDCTSLARSDIALDFNPPTNLVACETRVSTNAVGFSAGVGSLTLTAAGSGNSGTVLLTANLSSAAGSYCDGAGNYVAATNAAKPYLLGRWSDATNPDGNASTFYDDPASARAGFGLYGSQPKNMIFQRERY